jgi:hypothetical protein
MAERRVTTLIFLSSLLAYLYVFPHWLDWNQNTRIDLAMAIVERGTLQIDDYVSNTGDYAEFNGHAYSDKAPGLSFLAAPAYTVARILTDNDAARALAIQIGRSPSAAQTINRPIELVRPAEFTQAAQVAITTGLIVALPAALFGAALYRFLARFDLTARSRAWAVLAYGLATVVAPYSAALYGHVIAAGLLFSAWAWLAASRTRHASPLEGIAIGSLLGLAVITEYPAILIAALIGLYALITQRPRRRILWIIAGGLWPLVLLGAYNTAIFGSPFILTYQYVGNPRLRELIQTGVLSAGWPTWEAAVGLTFSPFRGLFFMSPVLLLSAIGFAITARDKAHRLEWWSSLSIVVAFALLVSGSAQWWGGWSVGPRYLIPLLPWSIWPLGAMIDRLLKHRWGAGVLIVLIAASCLSTWLQAAGGQYYAPDDILNPLFDYSWLRIIAGDVARNWGMIAGLRGGWSLLPLAILIAGAFGATWYATRRKGQPPLA